MKKENEIKEELTAENPSTEVEETAAEHAEECETPTEEAPAEDGASIEAELAEAQQQIEDLKDKNLRMMAEFENYRKRTAKEKLELQATAGERIFKDMLALVDDFERAQKAMAEADDINALREGIDLIYKKFVAFLEKHDVKEIATEDADFDVDKHEAITTLAMGDDKKGKIIDCTQKGYTLGDKVIRYSKVVVGA